MTGDQVPVTVRLEVVEGPHTVVAAVGFEGATAIAAAELASGLGLTAGKPYYRPQQTLDRAAVERRYRNLGYQRASVDVRETPSADGTAVAITYLVREGPQTRVDHVLVSGTERVSPELVRRELNLRARQPARLRRAAGGPAAVERARVVPAGADHRGAARLRRDQP